MAVTLRGYIFGAFASSFFSILLLLISISSDSWIVSTARAEVQFSDSTIGYGLFRGEFVLSMLQTPTVNSLHMTCVSDVSSCAVSCKTTLQGREDEVRALARGFRPSAACVATVAQVDESNPMANPPVISFAFYVCLLLILFLMLLFAVMSAILAIINATTNPTEPVFGLPGCLWANVGTAALGVIALITFGAYWAATNLNQYLAFAYIVEGTLTPDPSIGYSYWLLLPAVLCAALNVALLRLRQYQLEKIRTPDEIKVDTNSDGTIFLY